MPTQPLIEDKDDFADLCKDMSNKFRKKVEIDAKIRTQIADQLLEISKNIEKYDENKIKEKLRPTFHNLQKTEFGKKIQPILKKLTDDEGEDMPLGQPEKLIKCFARCDTKYGKDTWRAFFCQLGCILS